MHFSGADLFLQALVRRGIDRIFTLVGDHITQILTRCPGHGLRVVSARHEASAVHMAEAYALMTRKPAVCIVTSGPGTTNAITGVATASATCAPILVITAGVAESNTGRIAFQEVDAAELMRPVTKYSKRVVQVGRIPEMVDIAWREMLSGVGGPTHLSIPANLLFEQLDWASVYYPVQRRAIAQPHHAELDEAIEILKHAERPVLIAGHEIYWTGAEDVFLQLVDQMRVPFFTAGLAASGSLRMHPKWMGVADAVSNRAARAVQDADKVLIFGHRLNHTLSYGDTRVFGPKAKLIYATEDAREIGRNRSATLGLLGNVETTVAELLDRARRTTWSEPDRWIQHLAKGLQADVERRSAGESSNATPLHPLRILREIRDWLGDDGLLINDFGNFTTWSFDALANCTRKPWQLMGGMCSNLPTLGASIPWAIGAKLARPDRTVVAVLGDGAVGFNGWEIHTAAREGIPFVAVVGNDRAWGFEAHWRRANFNASEREIRACDLGDVPYHEFARMLGGHGELVEAPDQLRPALERAAASGLPALVNVSMASEPSPFVTGISQWWGAPSPITMNRAVDAHTADLDPALLR